MISNNFVVIGAELPVGRVMDLVETIKPDYVVLVRRDHRMEYRYVFLAVALLSAYRKFAPDPSSPTGMFLQLHEYHQDQTIDAGGVDSGLEDLEAAYRTSIGKALGMIESSGRIRAVVDLEAANPNATYVLPGLGYAYQRGEERTAELLRGVPPPPQRRQTRGSRPGKGNAAKPTLGAPSPPTPEGSVIERYPDARFPDRVAVGARADLEIVIRAQPIELTPSLKLTIPTQAGEIEIPVLIIVKPGTFEIDGDDFQEIRVPVRPVDSPVATFSLIARESGRQVVRVLLFPKGAFGGQLEIRTDVVLTHTEAASSAIRSTRADVPFTQFPPSPDLMLVIYAKSRNGGLTYDACLSSSKLGLSWGKFGNIHFDTDPEAKFREIFRDLEDANAPAAVTEQRVIAKGRSLYDELLPDKLKEEYWRIRDQIESIQVITDEPWIPWEIMKPWRRSASGYEEDPFLCERYRFSRWLENRTFKAKNRVERAKLVVPTDTDLENTIPERDWIQAFGQRNGLQVTYASQFEEVIASLERGGFDLLHFSSHGRYNPTYPNTSGVTLQEDIELRPENVTGLAAAFGKSNPLVVLNACQTGSQGFSLTRIGGWAAAFLDAGASSFIGTQWSVSDDVAYGFTQAFYERLGNGISLGRAVQEARLACRQTGDPSWLSYQLYAHPNSKIEFGPP